VSPGPERNLALGELLAAEGNPTGARRVLVELHRVDDRPGLLQKAALSIGQLAFADGDVVAAARALRDALEYGRPDRRQGPVVEAGDWVRRLVRRQPDIVAGHDWLSLRTGRDAEPGVSLIIEPLTDRETEVLGRLADALSTEDIADDLYLSVNTVKTHLKNIYRKLGASGRSVAARRARELRLLPPRPGGSVP